MHAALIQVAPLHPLIGIFYGIGVDNWLVHNIPLWFLPCLFLTHAIFYWIARIRNKPAIVFSILLSSSAGHLMLQYLSFRLPWSLEIALVAIAFYGSGFLLQDLVWHKKTGWIFVLTLIIVCILIQFIVIRYNDFVDMNSGRFGNIFLFYAGASTGIFLCMLIAKSLPYLKIITEIGKNTLVIFSLHMRMFSILTGITVIIFNIPLSFLENSLLAAISYSIVTIGILAFAGNLIRIYIPWVLGIRHKPALWF